MTYVKENRLEEACSILFGEDFSIEKSAFDSLQLSGIKRAYRTKVKEYHPDTAPGPGSEGFLKLKDAYDFLISMKSTGDRTRINIHSSPKAPAPPRRKLRLGEFLYYSGKISAQELTAAIAWHKRNSSRKVLFGMYFEKFGILSSAELGFSLFKLDVHNSNF